MSDASRKMKKTDLVLSNGEYAFTQDTTTGSVKVLTGPTVLNITGQEYPVVYDAEHRQFRAVDLEEATQQCPLAPQGYYIELWNPPESGTKPQPSEGSKENPPRLLMGQRVNIPGPATFALWPQQFAKVISGHHLRSNQYLVARIYDEEAAKENWKKTVLKSASGPAAESGEATGGEGTIAELTEDDLTVGKQFIIQGTEVSFYMPPTGVEVVPDEDGRYVREALTLERLQYCILVDENGDKDYQRGPRVVFPRPTQRFYRDGSGSSVFRPTELNPIQGIHVKVIAPYTEGDRRYAEGEELFITGRDTPIYFPRPEHALVKYDGSAKHFATAVPEGEARYVMDRNTGEIRTVRGPTMLLCDPRTQVVVRRVLTERQCALYYPGNEEAKEYNAALGALLPRRPSTRASVSEGEVRRSLDKGRGRGKGTTKPQGKTTGDDRSSVHSAASGAFADEWQRVATYSQPRTLTLDTKYSGVPTVSVWDGYAVMVVDKRGERRVESGPKDVLLEYDQTLQAVERSTGRPKSATTTEQTVYLRLADNRIEDELSVTTADHVAISLHLALSADFVGDEPARWFSVGNYVQRLCDRARRAVQEAVRATTIDAFYDEPTKVVRRALLGGAAEGGAAEGGAAEGDRAGVALDDLGMALREVEVLGCTIANERLAQQVDEARAYVVASRYGLERMARKLELDKNRLAMEREQASEQARTAKFRAELEAEQIRRELALHQARLESEVTRLAKQLDERKATELLADEEAARQLRRRQQEAAAEQEIGQAQLELRLAELTAGTEAAVARFKAAEGPLAEAIQLLGNQDILAKVAEATSAQRLLGGKDVADVVGKLFEGTPLASVFDGVQRRAIPRRANGSAGPSMLADED
ncbi:MAG: hypothetical protein AAGF11_28220 [Myxococcota bacterium]